MLGLVIGCGWGMHMWDRCGYLGWVYMDGDMLHRVIVIMWEMVGEGGNMWAGVEDWSGHMCGRLGVCGMGIYVCGIGICIWDGCMYVGWVHVCGMVWPCVRCSGECGMCGCMKEGLMYMEWVNVCRVWWVYLGCRGHVWSNVGYECKWNGWLSGCFFS